MSGRIDMTHTGPMNEPEHQARADREAEHDAVVYLSKVLSSRLDLMEARLNKANRRIAKLEERTKCLHDGKLRSS